MMKGKIRPKAFFYICWSTSPSPFLSLSFALFQGARRLVQLAELQRRVKQQQGERQRKERRGSERAKWLVGFRRWIDIDSPGRGCLHSADSFNKGQQLYSMKVTKPPLISYFVSHQCLKTGGQTQVLCSVICHVPVAMQAPARR